MQGCCEDNFKMKIDLPWPDKDLSPNTRIHFHKLAKAKKVYADQVGWAALGKNPHWTKEHMPIKLTFHPPARRHYDLDGLLSRCKAGLDQLAFMWKMNDKNFRPITIDFGEPVKDGKVVFEILK